VDQLALNQHEFAKDWHAEADRGYDPRERLRSCGCRRK
jgi:hypothetical protein